MTRRIGGKAAIWMPMSPPAVGAAWVAAGIRQPRTSAQIIIKRFNFGGSRLVV
jgi:hypothetical protein